MARSARHNVRPIQMPNTSRGCTDVQVELVTDLLYENGLAPAAADIIPSLTTARTSAGSLAQLSARALDNSSAPLAARAKERRISFSDAPQASRSHASFPLAMAGPSVILSNLQRSLVVIVQAPRCPDPNSSSSASRARQPSNPQSIRLPRFAWHRLPRFPARQSRSLLHNRVT